MGEGYTCTYVPSVTALAVMWNVRIGVVVAGNSAIVGLANYL